MPLPSNESELSLAYQLLPVLDEQSITPSITTRQSEQEFFRELLRHLNHAINEPEWLLDGTRSDVPMGKVLQTAKRAEDGFIEKIHAAYANGEENAVFDLIMRSMELLSAEHAGISFWRGGSYEPQDLRGFFMLNLSAALSDVMRHSASTSGTKPLRHNPVLIRLPVASLILNYRLNNARLEFEHGIEGLAMGGIGIQIPRCDEHTAIYFRPPADTVEQQEAYLRQLSREAGKLPLRFF